MRSVAAIALAGSALILTALMFESAVLFVPGVALILASVMAPGWVALAGRTAGVSRDLDADRVLEQQPLEATLEIVHGRLGLPGAHISDPLAGAPLALRVPTASARPARVEVRVVARFERRGRRVLAPPRLTLRDPLGLLELVRQGPASDQEVLVLPRIERPEFSRVGLSDRPRAGLLGPAAEALAATEVDGLQPYRPGTPASRIHWPALARGAGLLERRLRAEAGITPLVVLDSRCRQAGERLDRAVRAAASLSHHLAARTGCELLLPGIRRAIQLDPDLGAWPGAHARLALVEGGPSGPAPALTKRPGTVFYVMAELPSDAVCHQIGRLGHAVLVLPAELTDGLGRPEILQVSGCSGFWLPAGRRLEPDRARQVA